MVYIKEISVQKDWIHMNFDSEFKANMVSVELITHQMMKEYLQYFQYKWNNWYAITEKWMVSKQWDRF